MLALVLVYVIEHNKIFEIWQEKKKSPFEQINVRDNSLRVEKNMFTKCMFFYERPHFESEAVGFLAEKIMIKPELKILIVKLIYARFPTNEFPKNELCHSHILPFQLFVWV